MRIKRLLSLGLALVMLLAVLSAFAGPEDEEGFLPAETLQGEEAPDEEEPVSFEDDEEDDEEDEDDDEDADGEEDEEEKRRKRKRIPDFLHSDEHSDDTDDRHSGVDSQRGAFRRDAAESAGVRKSSGIRNQQSPHDKRQDTAFTAVGNFY